MAARTPVKVQQGYLTVGECAERLGCDHRTLRRHMKTARNSEFHLPHLCVMTVRTGKSIPRYWEANYLLAWYMAGEDPAKFPDLVKGLKDAYDPEKYAEAAKAVRKHLEPVWMKSV